MAVYTEIADAELIDFVASYDIGHVLSCKGIAEGVENSNYLLRTDKGPYILTLYEKRVDPADLPFFLGLMEHLAARGLTCPLPVHNRKGATLTTLAGRPAALVTFLDGVWLRSPNAQHCAELGAALARLHHAGEGFEIPRANALGVGGWRPLFNRFADQADSIAPDLKVTIARELDYLEARWPRDLPSGVIHADLFPNNVFFLGDKLSGLIDFYFACNDAYAYDVAVCINAWCFDAAHDFEIEKAQALLAAYHTHHTLTHAEREHLVLLARGAALRFLLTRAYDWINTPASALVNRHDPLEYLAKLRVFQAMSRPRDLGLNLGLDLGRDVTRDQQS
jgi:homoserine kinase type II